MPMISDEERREVAARLRYEESADPGCLNMIVEWYLLSFLQSINRAVDNGTEYRLRERLADLIDRPTCKNVSGCGDVFECSECKCRVELITEFGNDYGELFHVPRKPSFCPSCGAEVVPHAERRD